MRISVTALRTELVKSLNKIQLEYYNIKTEEDRKAFFLQQRDRFNTKSLSNIYQHLDSVVQNNTVCTMTDFLLPKLKPMYPDIVTIPFTESEGCPCQIVYPVTYLLSEADEVLISFLKVYFQNLQLIAQQTL